MHIFTDLCLGADMHAYAHRYVCRDTHLHTQVCAGQHTPTHAHDTLDTCLPPHAHAHRHVCRGAQCSCRHVCKAHAPTHVGTQGTCLHLCAHTQRHACRGTCLHTWTRCRVVCSHMYVQATPDTHSCTHLGTQNTWHMAPSSVAPVPALDLRGELLPQASLPSLAPLSS